MDGPPAWFAVLIQGGSFAIIAYMIVYQWPNAVDKIVASQDKMVTVFKSAYDKAVETFDRDLRDMASKASERHDATVRVFQDEQKYERANCEHLHKELLTVIDKNYQAVAESLRSARHEMRGHLQTVVNQLSQRRRTAQKPSEEASDA